MSITNYSELQTAVANWLHRADLTSYIPDLITLGEWKINRDLRLRNMETSLNSTIASGVIAIPSDYVDMKYCYVDGTPTQPLQRKSAEWILSKYPLRGADGKPAFFATDASNFIFGPYPDSNYTIKGTYYKRLTALSGSNTTNWFTTNAPDLLLYAALCEAEPFLKNDERILTWAALYEKARKQIQDEDDREQHSGSPLRVSSSWS